MKRSIFTVLVVGLTLASSPAAWGEESRTELESCRNNQIQGCAFHLTQCSIGRKRLCDEKLCKVATADCRSVCKAEEKVRQAAKKAEIARGRIRLAIQYCQRSFPCFLGEGRAWRTVQRLEREATVLHNRSMRVYDALSEAMDKSRKSKDRLHEAVTQALEKMIQSQKEAIEATPPPPTSPTLAPEIL